MQEQSKNTEVFRFRLSLFFSILLVAIMWIVKLFEVSLDFSAVNFGVYPRTLHGLKGILFSPFIHGSFEHLFSNTFPFLILFGSLVFFYPKKYFRVFILMYFLSGIILWYIGRPSYHIGASGVIYSLAAFHFFSGVLSRRNDFIAISLIVVFLYGGIIWGLFPGIDDKMSWEGHLAGFTIGALLSIFFHPKNEKLNHSQIFDLKVNFNYFYNFKCINSTSKKNLIYKNIEKKSNKTTYQIHTNEKYFNNYPADFYVDDNFWTT